MSITSESQDYQVEIERARRELAESILALREKVKSAGEWRTWVRHQPWVWLGAAGVAGFWLGYRRRRR